MGNKKILKYWLALKIRLFSFYHVILVKRDGGTPCLQDSLNTEIEFRKVNDEMLGDTSIFEKSTYRETYAKMLQEGQYGVFGYINNRCVYRRWVKPIDAVEFRGVYKIPLDRSSMLFHFDYCAPEARGKRIHSEDIRQMCIRFSDKDCYATIVPNNFASMHGYLKNGFYKELDVRVGYCCFIPYRFTKKIYKRSI